MKYSANDFEELNPNSNPPAESEVNPPDNPSVEPEEYISSIKYLAELIQMDLNFGRKETIPARARAILENAIGLAKLYSRANQTNQPGQFSCSDQPIGGFNSDLEIGKEKIRRAIQEKYKENGYTEMYTEMDREPNFPSKPGLYSITCEEIGWEEELMALSINDYRQLIVHDQDFG